MNKIIPAHLLLYFVCLLHQFSIAQNASSRAVEFKPIYTVTSLHQPNGSDASQDLNTSPAGEKKENIVLKKSTSPNKATKQQPTTTDAAKTSTNIAVKKQIPATQQATRQELIKLKEQEDLSVEENSSETIIDHDAASKNSITYPDLQVTATKEEITPSQNVGTERPPNTTITKKSTIQTDQPTPTKDSSSKIGKVEFLKQYVEELKMLIEKNKNDPAFPLAEKQKELEDIVNLLKQE